MVCRFATQQNLRKTCKPGCIGKGRIFSFETCVTTNETYRNLKPNLFAAIRFSGFETCETEKPLRPGFEVSKVLLVKNHLRVTTRFWGFVGFETFPNLSKPANIALQVLRFSGFGFDSAALRPKPVGQVLRFSGFQNLKTSKLKRNFSETQEFYVL